MEGLDILSFAANVAQLIGFSAMVWGSFIIWKRRRELKR